MGKVEKGVSCSVNGCKNPSERSVGRDTIKESGLTVSGDGKRAYLCRDHYKTWKKATKKDRDMQRARWG